MLVHCLCFDSDHATDRLFLSLSPLPFLTPARCTFSNARRPKRSKGGQCQSGRILPVCRYVAFRVLHFEETHERRGGLTSMAQRRTGKLPQIGDTCQSYLKLTAGNLAYLLSRWKEENLARFSIIGSNLESKMGRSKLEVLSCLEGKSIVEFPKLKLPPFSVGLLNIGYDAIRYEPSTETFIARKDEHSRGVFMMCRDRRVRSCPNSKIVSHCRLDTELAQAIDLPRSTT